jgi:hypothetical protein
MTQKGCGTVATADLVRLALAPALLHALRQTRILARRSFQV